MQSPLKDIDCASESFPPSYLIKNMGYPFSSKDSVISGWKAPSNTSDRTFRPMNHRVAALLPRWILGTHHGCRTAGIVGLLFG